MDGIKGLHGLLTGVFAILIIWVAWFFVTPLFSSTSTIITTIYWASFTIVSLLAVLGIPMLISWDQGDGEASIGSMVMMFGVYLAGVLFMQIFFPLIDALTGSQSPFEVQLHIQIMSALILLAGIVALFVLPILVGIAPKSVYSIGEEILR